MSSGYVIAHVEVTNPAQYEEYKKWSSVAMQAHGAEVCVRGGQVQPLEGDLAAHARGRAQVRQLREGQGLL
jgi:uncharacterized protein (DUF1330 family)